MCPPLSAAQAARCHAAFTSDVLARVRGAAGARVVLMAAPDADAPELARLSAEHGVELAWQGAGHLGMRLERALGRAAEARATAVAIGSDSPDLPLAHIVSGFEEAERSGAAIGPAEDGGFYLLGCAGFRPALGAVDPPWGGARVLAATVACLEAGGPRVARLAEWYDVDDVAGLRRLAQGMRAARERGDDPGLPRSERVLAELAGEGLL
jgi:glycosyltransferase A (GT-A) superfamily protein (DUF2064 family)